MILYVLRYYPTLTETFVHDEIRGLAARGIAVELAAFDPRGDPGVEPLGVPVHSQPHRWGWIAAIPTLVREWLRKPAIVSKRVLWLSSVLRRSRRAHVHFAGEAAEWLRAACERVGIPYSVTAHAVDLFKPRPLLGPVLHDAAAVVTVSTFHVTFLRETFDVASEIVRYGVDPAGFGRLPPSDPPVVLGVGRFVPKKGFDKLVAVAPRIERRCVVRLVSDAPPSPGVDVIGLQPRAVVRDQMARATVFVLPCRRAPDGDMDGLPVVIIEAMATGLPIITTGVSGIPDLVDDEVGWIVPVDDEEALLAAIRAALDDPAGARRKGELGRERMIARGFTHEANVSAMARILGA